MIQFDRIVEHALSSADAASAVRLRLTYDERVKSRLATMTVDGRAVAITLPRGSVLHDGTVLGGGQGFGIVEAAPQPLTRVSAATPLALLRAVYHLANRHVPVQLAVDCLLIERDPVLESMLRPLGAQLEQVQAPFTPEGGAYHGAPHSHGHERGDEIDEASRTVGEQLSIAAHARRQA